MYINVYVRNKLLCHIVHMKYFEINNFYIPVFHLIKYEEIVVIRTKIEIYFVFGRLGIKACVSNLSAEFL